MTRDPRVIPWTLAKAPVTAGGEFDTANGAASDLAASKANLPRTPYVRIVGVLLGYDVPGLGTFYVGNQGTPWNIPIGPANVCIPLDLGVVETVELRDWRFAGAVKAGGTSSLLVGLLLQPLDAPPSPKVCP